MATLGNFGGGTTSPLSSPTVEMHDFAYPTLTRQAIHAAVAYAADLARDEYPAVSA